MDMCKQLLTVDTGRDADGVKVGLNLPTKPSAKSRFNLFGSNVYARKLTYF
jgi:hypothetical protein